METLDEATKERTAEPPYWDPEDPVDYGKPSRAVIACYGGTGIVICTVGGHVETLMRESGSRMLDSLGLDDAPDGITVWEGAFLPGSGRPSPITGEHDDLELAGAFRDPTPEEWEAITEKRTPWDRAEWVKPRSYHLDDARAAIVEMTKALDSAPYSPPEAEAWRRRAFNAWRVFAESLRFMPEGLTP